MECLIQKRTFAALLISLSLLGCEQLEKKKKADNGLSFSVAERSLAVKAGSCTPVHILSLNAQGGLIQVAEETPISIQGIESSIAFRDSACQNRIESLNLPAGQSQFAFYLRPLLAGNYLVSLDDGWGGYAPGSLSLDVTAGPATAFKVTGHPQLLKSACSEPFLASVVDAYGNITFPPNDFSVSLSATANGKIFKDAACTMALAEVALEDDIASVPFYIKNDSLERFVVRGTPRADSNYSVSDITVLVQRSLPTQISINVADNRVKVGECSQPFRVQLLSSNLVAAPVNPEKVISLAVAGSGKFYRDANCGSAVSQVTIAAEESSSLFYYKGDSAETPTFTADDGPGGFTAGKLKIFVMAEIPGAVDKNFGTNGFSEVSFGGGETELTGLAVDSQGRIVAVGNYQSTIAITRWLANGASDGSFGQGGKLLLDVGDKREQAFSLAIQADGKIVIGGTVGENDEADFLLIRLLSEGALDETFGTNGVGTYSLSSSADWGRSVAVQTDGRILLAGGANGDTDFGVIRISPQGLLDSEFGTEGVVITNLRSRDRAYALALQKDGKIVVAGQAYDDDFGIARYLTNGSLDTGFGSAETGKLIKNHGDDEYVAQVSIADNGKIYLTGTSKDGDDSDVIVDRLNSDGNYDGDFNADGSFDFSTSNYGGQDEAYALCLTPDGKAVVAGNLGPLGSSRAGMLRVNTVGLLDNPLFGGPEGTVYPTVEASRISSLQLHPGKQKFFAGLTKAKNAFVVGLYGL